MVCLEAGRSFNLLFRPSGVSPMIFDDRIQAAELLAQRLEPYRGQNPLVLAIPRGAVPMGRVIADALEGDLDVVLVHKLSAPLQPELAIGSVSEAGDVYLGDLVEQLGVGQEYIDAEVKTGTRNAAPATSPLYARTQVHERQRSHGHRGG